MRRQIPSYILLYSYGLLLLSWQWHTCDGFTLGVTRDKTRTEFRFSRWTTTSTTDTAAAVIATPIKAAVVGSKRRTSYLSASLEETNQDILSTEFNTISNDNDDGLILPRHATNMEANQILSKAQSVIETMQTSLIQNKDLELLQKSNQKVDMMGDGGVYDGMDNVAGVDRVYSNSYVDLGKVDTVGFDFDYTLG